MPRTDISTTKNRNRIRCLVTFGTAAGVIVVSILFFFYPAFFTLRVVFDSHLAETGNSRAVPSLFKSVSSRFNSWAQEYLESSYAEDVESLGVSGTEWPIFGATLFLVTASDLHSQNKINAQDEQIREAINQAAKIVASPATATWVKHKWGKDYLKKKNVFYRMLLILGLSSHEKIIGNGKYVEVLNDQRESLATELLNAPFHMAEDYPGECYPNDVLWAVAAIQRAARLQGLKHPELVSSVMEVLDNRLKSNLGLPAFQVNAQTGKILQNPRGSGNSGIIAFAAELRPEVAKRWYEAYEKHFWKQNMFIAGFTEMPKKSDKSIVDVDSGPVFMDFGSVASAFGIGAAKAVGRYDHSVPLTMEAFACSWPTPFGFIIPGVMGKIGADSWCLGEVALLFSLSRPARTTDTVPFTGHVPGIVWIIIASYLVVGSFLIWFEVRACARFLHELKQTQNDDKSTNRG